MAEIYLRKIIIFKKYFKKNMLLLKKFTTLNLKNFDSSF